MIMYIFNNSLEQKTSPHLFDKQDVTVVLFIASAHDDEGLREIIPELTQKMALPRFHHFPTGMRNPTSLLPLLTGMDPFWRSFEHRASQRCLFPDLKQMKGQMMSLSQNALWLGVLSYNIKMSYYGIHNIYDRYSHLIKMIDSCIRVTNCVQWRRKLAKEDNLQGRWVVPRPPPLRFLPKVTLK